jgi:hypothetical protein
MLKLPSLVDGIFQSAPGSSLLHHDNHHHYHHHDLYALLLMFSFAECQRLPYRLTLNV